MTPTRSVNWHFNFITRRRLTDPTGGSCNPFPRFRPRQTVRIPSLPKAHAITSVTCLLVFVGGCGGTSLAIAVKPDRFICPGTPITLTWQASRAPRITATPSVPGLTDLPNLGVHQATINATTHFVIEGGHWWWINQTEADAIVYDPALAQFPASGGSKLQFGNVGSEVQCSSDVAWAAFDQGPDHWDPHLTIGSVRAAGGAKLSVWHGGIHAQIDSTPSSAFSGVSVQGIWLLETSCHPRPRAIGIELTATCNPNASSGGPHP